MRDLNSLLSVLLTAVIFLVGLNAFAQYQPADVWGTLESGPYAVGFKSVEMYDSSRSFLPKFDYYRNEIEGYRTRQIQICYWYPAVDDDNAPRMSYAEYAYPFPENMDFMNILSRIQDKEIGFIASLFGNSREAALDIINVEMAAKRELPPADGKFPLVLYLPYSEAGIGDNAVLCEYLASHGYIVYTTHPLGLHDLRVEMDMADFEASMKDRELALAYMKSLDFADYSDFGVIGYADGGLGSIVYPMRNLDAEFSVMLHGLPLAAPYLDFARKNPYYDEEKMQIPLAVIYGGDNPDIELSLDLIDSLKFADRHIYKFDSANFFNFGSYGILADEAGRTELAGNKVYRAVYEQTCRTILEFAKMILEKQSWADEKTETGLHGPVEYSYLKSEPYPPTMSQFMGILGTKGVKAAHEIYEKFHIDYPDRVFFQEPVFNMLGYRYMNQGDMESALTVLKMNTEAHPSSANCWDSYAEALANAGNYEEARKCYERMLGIIDEDNRIDDQFKQRLKDNAHTFMEQHPAQ